MMEFQLLWEFQMLFLLIKLKQFSVNENGTYKNYLL